MIPAWSPISNNHQTHPVNQYTTKNEKKMYLYIASGDSWDTQNDKNYYY